MTVGQNVHFCNALCLSEPSPIPAQIEASASAPRPSSSLSVMLSFDLARIAARRDRMPVPGQ